MSILERIKAALRRKATGGDTLPDHRDTFDGADPEGQNDEQEASEGFDGAGLEHDPDLMPEDADAETGPADAAGSVPEASSRKAKISGWFNKRKKGVPETVSSPDVSASTLAALSADGAEQLVPTFKERGVVEINGKDYAAGLIWSGYNQGTPVKNQAVSARDVSAGTGDMEPELDLYVDQRARGFLAFGSAEWGQSKGMPALVESFNEAVLGERWLMVLKLEGSRDSWWVGARRDGDVFEDRVLLSKEDATEVFGENISAPGWKTVIAPDDWRVQSTASNLPLAIITKTSAKMRLVDPVRAYAPRAIGIGILVAAMIGGGVYYLDMRSKHLAEMEELRLQIERAVTLMPADFPWHDRTTPAMFVEECMNAIEDAIVMTPGWELQPFTCRVERGRATLAGGWTRSGGGRIDWLRAAIPEGHPPIAVNVATSSVTTTHRFTMPVDARALVHDPWPRTQMENRMRERFQVYDLTMQMRLVEDRRDPAVNPLFHRHDMNVTGSMDLAEFARFLADVPAVVPDALSYNIASSTWSLVLRVYHPVILPEITQ